MSSELGTYMTAKARVWSWLSSERTLNLYGGAVSFEY